MNEVRTEAGQARCVATKPRLDPTLPLKQCPRPAKYGEWCRQHAESLGGWRLAPPDRAEARASAFAQAEEAVKVLDGVHVPWPRPQRGDHDYGINAPKLVYAQDVLAAIADLRTKGGTE